MHDCKLNKQKMFQHVKKKKKKKKNAKITLQLVVLPICQSDELMRVPSVLMQIYVCEYATTTTTTTLPIENAIT